MAHGVFHIVAEDPQVEHVSQDVEQASVDEHCTEESDPQRKSNRGWKVLPRKKLAGYESVGEHELLARGNAHVGDGPLQISEAKIVYLPGRDVQGKHFLGAIR